jgi:serine protease Do
LVNLNSELIGINSQILSGGGTGGNIGIGFSIPSNMAKSVMDQLLKDGKVHRGQLGVRIQNITEDTAKALELENTKGVLVSEVVKGGAAEKAGIQRGDIITAVNGETVEDTNVLRNKIAGTAPGTAVKLTIVRDGKQQDVTITLEEFNVEKAMKNADQQDEEQGGNEKQNGKLGLSLQPVTPAIARQLGVSADQGLVVTDLDPTGPAAEAGIGRGDIILEINKRAVSSIEDVQAALEKADSKPILLLISRRGQTIYLTVRPG